VSVVFVVQFFSFCSSVLENLKDQRNSKAYAFPVEFRFFVSFFSLGGSFLFSLVFVDSFMGKVYNNLTDVSRTRLKKLKYIAYHN